jgi:hypothetical protein
MIVPTGATRAVRAADQSAKAMPPLWQYFWRLLNKKANESMAAPKGHGPRALAAFSLYSSPF